MSLSEGGFEVSANSTTGYHVDTSGRLWSINLTSNVKTLVGALSYPALSMTNLFGLNVDGLAFRSNVLYGVVSSDFAGAGLSNRLITINTSTAAITDVGPLGIGVSIISGTAYSPALDVFYLASGNALYRINPVTGAATLIGNTGLSSPSGLAFAPAATGGGMHTVVLGPGQVVDGKDFGNAREKHPLPGDVNSDGKVDLIDFNIVKTSFGRTSPPALGDLDGDGVVALGDFLLVKENFGRTASEDLDDDGWLI
jgi:hypothetical protein